MSSTIAAHEPVATPEEVPHDTGRALGARVRQIVVDSSFTWFAISGVAMVAVWALAVALFDIPEYILPAPSVVFSEIVDNRALLTTNAGVTLREILIGYVLSVVVGMAVAVLISLSPIVEKLVYPVLVMTQAIPKIALAPLFLIWLGYGATTNAVIAVLIAFFPIVINGAVGLSSLDNRMVVLAQSMGAKKWQVYWHFRLPNSLPYVFAGLKLGIAMATIGAVLGEFIAGSAGLGYLSQSAAGTLNTPLAMACITILSILGVLLFFVVEAVERLVMPWHAAQSSVVGS